MLVADVKTHRANRIATIAGALVKEAWAAYQVDQHGVRTFDAALLVDSAVKINDLIEERIKLNDAG